MHFFGKQSLTSVELDKPCIQVLRRNLNGCQLNERLTLKQLRNA